MSEKVVHDPYRLSTRWCRVVLWQASRLREALLPPGAASGLRPGFFDRIAAEQHFLLTATSQLSAALSALGTEVRLPDELDRTLRVLRNVREHWDEWHIDKRSPATFRDQWPDRSPWTLEMGADRISLAGLVSLEDLESAVRALLARLLEQRAAETAARGEGLADG